MMRPFACKNAVGGKPRFLPFCGNRAGAPVIFYCKIASPLFKLADDSYIIEVFYCAFAKAAQAAFHTPQKERWL